MVDVLYLKIYYITHNLHLPTIWVRRKRHAERFRPTRLTTIIVIICIKIWQGSSGFILYLYLKLVTYFIKQRVTFIAYKCRNLNLKFGVFNITRV